MRGDRAGKCLTVRTKDRELKRPRGKARAGKGNTVAETHPAGRSARSADQDPGEAMVGSAELRLADRRVAT